MFQAAAIYDTSSINQERFDSLVAYLEDYVRRHPTRYTLRGALLAALGYAFVIILEGEYKGLRGTFKSIPGAEIFPRD